MYVYIDTYTFICLCMYVFGNCASKETFSEPSVLDLQPHSYKKKALQVILSPVYPLYLLTSTFLVKKPIKVIFNSSRTL